VIAAIVLAAGLSQRMGRPKMVLPWGDKTIIEQVVSAVREGGIPKIIVVTGGARLQVENFLYSKDVKFVFNPDFNNGEMLCSVQIGLKQLDDDVEAVIIVLGDQPQILSEVVKKITEYYEETKAKLIFPSYQMKKGHPWLIARSLWSDILKIAPPKTLRDFTSNIYKEINYLVVDTPTILKDIDNYEDYEREKPVTKEDYSDNNVSVF
jgi:molybdenum cofactor cytidylyltransferase